MVIESKKFLSVLSKLNKFNVVGFELLPFIVVVKDKTNKKVINHELIHSYQQLETLVIGYWIIYLFNYLVNLIKYKKHILAYKNILFEIEAYNNSSNENYLKTRKLFSWMKEKKLNEI